MKPTIFDQKSTCTYNLKICSIKFLDILKEKMYIQGLVIYMYIIVYIHVSMNHCDKIQTTQI